MPPPPSRTLTLIVATTPTGGIGAANALPWPTLKGELAHFRRATAAPRPPPADPAVPNAVLMGRNTWESIPARFRPLAGRVNVVVTSRPESVEKGEGTEGPRTARSLREALERAWADERVGETFVIGGAGMYAAALGEAACRRVLLTRIGREYDCDVRFPLDMDGEEARAAGWRRGDVVREGWAAEGETRHEDKGVPYEFCLYERP